MIKRDESNQDEEALRKDYRFPPPFTASPGKLNLTTNDGRSVVYHLLYQNSDPDKWQQGEEFKAATKEVRKELGEDFDYDKFVEKALRSGKGVRKISSGPRGNIWQISAENVQLVSCLIGMNKVQVKQNGRCERFDLFGEGLKDIDEEVLLISSRVID